MSIKRLLKKTLGGGVGPVYGHIFDAMDKKTETGRSFTDCLKESVKETLTEDLPGSSHLYQAGRQEGKKQGISEQATRDERKFRQLHQQHEEDRRRWKETDKKKDKFIRDMINDK